LQRVREDQVQFVASNAVSLAELNFWENSHAAGIFLGDEMIGFTLTGQASPQTPKNLF
jgi:diamine N-acetyltransferase